MTVCADLAYYFGLSSVCASRSAVADMLGMGGVIKLMPVASESSTAKRAA